MTREEMFARCDAAGTELAGPMFEALADASVTANAVMESRRAPGWKNAWLFSGLMRTDVRRYFRERGLPDGWELGGNPERSGQLKFVRPSERLEIRVLKESRVTKNGVPAAGASRARKDSWGRELDLFDAAGVDRGSGVGVVHHNELLLLWNYDEEAGFSARLVHPIEPGKYRGVVRYDYSRELVLGSTLQEMRRYEPDASEEYQIMEVDIEADEDFSEGAAGA
ncbi:hypothetical protein [Timonella senegalensis]|uniref:hypothetical protein n=1 Tax=Timonella senegalensis TaxID=1465825 RepID=UPI002FDE4C66